jgi:small neutral amino acid transporter SnatA (MarC family)
VTTAGRRLAATAGVVLGAAALTFGVAAPPERCPEITAGETRDAAAAAVGWMVDNQRPDGTWLYEYERTTDTAADDYNEVRHAGVMSSLYQAATREYARALESADAGLRWARDHLVERHGWIGMTDSNAVQAGSNALLLAALAERRVATGDDAHDELMAGLARFLTSQTEPSGALLAYYDLGPDEPRAGVYSIYYTGEAQWALARMHLLFPDDGWDETADRMLHYMATVRDDVEEVWPPLADHWAGYGLATTAAYPERPTGEPLTTAELEMVRRQGGLFGQRVRSISQRFGPWGVLVRGTFTPRGGGYGVFGEGLTGLWRAALLDDRLAPERDTLAERATCIAGLAMDAQVSREEADQYPDPTKVAGAWFIDDVTRMDDQQHAVSALMMTIPILELTPDTVPDAIHPAPMWLLWLLVVIATVNPLRVALGTPARSSGERIRLALAGSTIAAVGLLGVASLSGWIVDLVGTSRPALRLGAAALCMLTAVVDTARPRPPTEPVATGWAAALVPVAVPLTARAAVVIAGLSVVADHSLPFYGLVLALLIIATGVATLVEPSDGVVRRLVIAGVRMTAAIAFVGGALLVADAVFDL